MASDYALLLQTISWWDQDATLTLGCIAPAIHLWPTCGCNWNKVNSEEKWEQRVPKAISLPNRQFSFTSYGKQLLQPQMAFFFTLSDLESKVLVLTLSLVHSALCRLQCLDLNSETFPIGMLHTLFTSLLQSHPLLFCLTAQGNQYQMLSVQCSAYVFSHQKGHSLPWLIHG